MIKKTVSINVYTPEEVLRNMAAWEEEEKSREYRWFNHDDWDEIKVASKKAAELLEKDEANTDDAFELIKNYGYPYEYPDKFYRAVFNLELPCYIDSEWIDYNENVE